MTTDLAWMEQALTLARQAMAVEEVPVGALVVLKGVCIGAGYNQVRKRCDPCAHAEILAIQQACQTLGYERLVGATVYVTLEPCVMCMGALLHARIDRLVFGTRDIRAGAAGSKLNLARGHELYAPMQVDEGLCQDACAGLLKTFFKKERGAH